jgi:hypothetical protein
MSSKTLEPRQAAPGAARRWTLQAVTLIGRAPLSFGLLLLATVVVDRLTTDLSAFWLAPLGALLYWPLFAAALIAARQADDAPKPTGSLALTVIRIGASAAALCAFLVWLPRGPGTPIHTASFWNLAAMWGSLAFYITGAFLLPLVGFSRISAGAALRLSWRGHRRNVGSSLGLSLLLMSTTVGLPLVLPLPMVGFVPLLHAALAYVAYREIFEGRACNAVVHPVIQLRPATVAIRRSAR